MSKALFLDLRLRVLAADEAGASHRQAAERFGVSAASVSRWRTLARETGEPRPGPLGGDRRSGWIEAQGGLIRALPEATPDITIEELRRRLSSRASQRASDQENVEEANLRSGSHILLRSPALGNLLAPGLGSPGRAAHRAPPVRARPSSGRPLGAAGLTPSSRSWLLQPGARRGSAAGRSPERPAGDARHGPQHRRGRRCCAG